MTVGYNLEKKVCHNFLKMLFKEAEAFSISINIFFVYFEGRTHKMRLSA